MSSNTRLGNQEEASGGGAEISGRKLGQQVALLALGMTHILLLSWVMTLLKSR